MANQSNRVVVILIALLVAVMAVGAVVWWVLPGGSGGPAEQSVRDPESLGFNVRVLQTGGFLALDKQLITEGALPVQPPPNTGKANPFLQ